MDKLFPGVYTHKSSSECRKIEGANTSTAAFIGVTEKGPLDHALMVISFAEFQINFGNFLSESWLTYSAFQFFNNGGTCLYIARVIGHESAAPQEIDYQNAFALLDQVKDISIVAVPGIGSSSMVSYGADYCQKRGDCFFVGDMSLADNTIEKATTFIDDISNNSSYAAVYFPWLKMNDPSGDALEPIAVPPSGFIAGIYARLDAKLGVWKAAAGKESYLNGAVELLVDMPNSTLNALNPIGVNGIRALPDSSIVIWGARTLAAQSNSEYRYIPVRRAAIYIEQSICNSISWVEFEQNDARLWASIRLTISSFLMEQWHAGALCGNNSEHAFFVKCDNETTSYADIEAGVVNIVVGVAPLRPAEFVVLKLSQKVGKLIKW